MLVDIDAAQARPRVHREHRRRRCASRCWCSTPTCACGRPAVVLRDLPASRPRRREGRLLYELGNGQWDIPDAAPAPRGDPAARQPVQRLRGGARVRAHRQRTMLLNARRLVASRRARPVDPARHRGHHRAQTRRRAAAISTPTNCRRTTAARTSSWRCWPTNSATRWPRSATPCRSCGCEARRRRRRRRGVADDGASGRPDGPAGGRPARREPHQPGQDRTSQGAGRTGVGREPRRRSRPAVLRDHGPSS